MKLKNYILIALLFSSVGLFSQTVPPVVTGTIDLLRVEPSLASKSKLKSAKPLTEEPKDGRSSKNLVIPGKDKQMEDDFLAKTAHPLTGTFQARMPELVFEVNNNVSSPSDPSIAVGPEHAFIVYNTGFIIYDKEGNDLTGPLNVNNIFSNGGCCDLTASYDNAADRWVITYLFFSSGAEIAISDGPDPLTSDWYVYSIPQISDYQKLSVWSDGYYITDNTGGSNRVWALERAEMLTGNAGAGVQGFELPGIVTSGFFSPQVLNVIDDNLPADGGVTVIYEQDDAWGGVSVDHVKFWNIDVDWSNSANSTVSVPETFNVTPFVGVFDGGSFSNLTQPGGGSDIDALQATIMNQAQFRKFPSHNSALFNFVIDVEGGTGELAAIRWYEFRQDGDGMPWTMYQEGTYTAPDDKHAWMGSMAMDFQGNIGMGYSAMAGPDTPNPTSNRVSAFYTGRYASDPLGTMTIGEELISQGTSNVSGIRFGDYAKLDLDPVNQKEFWFCTEYANTNVVGVFQIASDFENDLGVVALSNPVDGSLTANEAITITIFNYGSTDASGFNVTYQIDGNAVVTEAYSGTISSATTAEYTFSTTADLSTVGQSYSIVCATDYDIDEFADNDALTSVVTHLSPNDVGVTSLDNPTSGSGLSSSETITISITNFGGTTQTSIPVFYTLNGGTAVEETFTGSLSSGETVDYSFSTTADFSGLGDYDIVSGTVLDGDADTSNDNFSTTIFNFICQPESDCAGFNDGVTVFEFADQDITVDCGDGGYSDDTDIIFNFIMADNPFSGTVQVGYAGDFAIWIDFNDDNSFGTSERIVFESSSTADVDFDFSVDLTDFANITDGEHVMRVRGGDPAFEGDINDPCSDLTYGRTNDFTANISGSVGIDGSDFAAADLSIVSLAGNQFELQFATTKYLDKLPVTVYNGTGQILAFYTLENTGSGYSKMIDMSYVSAGVYFVKVGEESLNKVNRIIVR